MIEEEEEIRDVETRGHSARADGIAQILEKTSHLKQHQTKLYISLCETYRPEANGMYKHAVRNTSLHKEAPRLAAAARTIT